MTLLGAGGAGVAPVFTPLDISNLQAWYKADAGITLNGSNVSQWDDQSGNARHMIQATASNQPTFTALAKNGLPGLTFDGTNDFLALAADYDMLGASTYFVVWKATDEGENSVLSGVSGNYTYLQYGATWYIGSISANIAMTSGLWYLRAATADATNNLSERFSNSVSQGTTGANVSYRKIRYIGQYNSEANRYLYGVVSEILIYNKKLTSPEITDVNNYLNSKYAIY
ncbi:MAG: hypothetical protein Q7W13_13995 [Bacteroidia bacterium]|nr:hypothetical protein [Bacteroidia bacterium]